MSEQVTNGLDGNSDPLLDLETDTLGLAPDTGTSPTTQTTSIDAAATDASSTSDNGDAAPSTAQPAVTLTGSGQLLDAAGLTLDLDSADGLVIGSINQWSTLGQELDFAQAYSIHEFGATALFDGVTVAASYFSLTENGGADAPLAATALDAALSFGDVVTNIAAITGSDGGDVFYGHNFDDTFEGGAGNDQFYGGGGNDTARFSGNRGDYEVVEEHGGVRITGPDGSDFVRDVELFEFDNGSFTVDELLNGPEYELIDAAGADFTVDIGDFDGAIIGAVNPWSALGQDVDHGQAYHVHGVGAEATFNGQTEGATYFSTSENKGADGQALADSALDAALAFGDVVQNAGVITGTQGADTFYGRDFDDGFEGGAGDDRFYGGGGEDLARFSGTMADYTIEADGAGYRINGADGSDFVQNVELFEFDDGVFTLDEMLGVSDHELIDAGGYDVTVDVGKDGADGVVIGSVNTWSTLGSELGFVEAYNVHAKNATATFDGVEVDAHYFSVLENRDRDGTTLSDSALSAALAFGDVLINVNGIKGTDGDDVFWGRGFNDRFEGGGGDDTFYGGGGDDYAVLSGNRNDYTIERAGAGFRVIGPDGADYIENVEYLAFDDGTFALDADTGILSTELAGPCAGGGGAVCRCESKPDTGQTDAADQDADQTDASHDHSGQSTADQSGSAETDASAQMDHSGHTDSTDTSDQSMDSGAAHDHSSGGSTTDAGTTDTGSSDHSGHSDHTATADIVLTPPTTPEEADAFVAAVKAMDDSGAGHAAHATDAAKAHEHGEMLDLVPRAEATHIAISDGDWFDPDTWYNGEIPGDGAKVVIPQGIAVTYDGESDASIFTIRVDGELSFATNVDTKLIVDTMVVDSTGRLEIGTEDNPIEAGVNATILIANNGDIDVAWDPSLLSRGVISHGEVEIHGQEKTSHLKVADAPMAGDTSITLAEIPTGWQVGDTIVLTGTHKQGWAWDNDVRAVVHKESQDEEVVITGIEGGTIFIDRPLQFDHDAPQPDLAAYVGNMSRNVTIASEDGDATAVHHRGHVMFMHNDDVDVRYAAFDDLGRTDKSVEAFDVGTLDTVASDSNVKGRYSFHFHKTGTEDLENPALAIGNTVSGSPGWGFVHHSSHADFLDNVAFDVFGAAFAAEDGDETGSWNNNLAVKSEGIGYGDATAKRWQDVERHDNGRTGDGFFFAGRLVEAEGNVAANTTNGYVWMTRSAPSAPSTSAMEHHDLGYGLETVSSERTPIRNFTNNEAFGNATALMVVKANPAMSHDVRNVFTDFTAWEVSEGVNLSYASAYTFIDFTLIGTQNTAAVAYAHTAINLHTNTFDIVFNGLDVQGFGTGADLNVESTFSDGSDFDATFIDAKFMDVGQEFLNYIDGQHSVLSSADLTPGQLSYDPAESLTVQWQDTTTWWMSAMQFDGVKTDSIGSVDRLYDGGPQGLTMQQVVALMNRDGYYSLEDGSKVLLVNDYIADRATGETLKMTHAITLDFTQEQFDYIGGEYKGLITLGGAAPTAIDDTGVAIEGTLLNMDVVANDLDADSSFLFLEDVYDAQNGDVTRQDDGTLTYRPYEGFTGEDSFTYLVGDGKGNFDEGLVTITVLPEDMLL